MDDSAVTNIIKLAVERSRNDDGLVEAFQNVESALNRELTACCSKLEAQHEQPSISLLESIAEIQCAIDIIHSANTPEQRKHVYSILKEIKTV